MVGYVLAEAAVMCGGVTIQGHQVLFWFCLYCTRRRLHD
jgi:hypothetical protein